MRNKVSIAVTRFNWPHPKWHRVSEPVYLEWLEDRIKAFKKFTVPSISNCYIKPDCWFILCDDSVCKDIAERLSSILKGLNFKIVRYIGLSIEKTIINHIKNFEFPIQISMTRLDSDDLVASDFFARIKNLEIQCLDTPIIISFPGGSNYDCNTNEFYFSSYPENPFLTLVEELISPNDAHTVYCRMHTEMLNGDFNIRLLRSSHPMWSSVIHKATTQNQSLSALNKFALRDTIGLMKKFGISSSIHDL
jgi:Putative rhamnosyl transferase